MYEDYTGTVQAVTRCGLPDRETIVSSYVFPSLVLRTHSCISLGSFSLKQSKKLRRTMARVSFIVRSSEESFGRLANETAVDGGHCHYAVPGTSSTHPLVHYL